MQDIFPAHIRNYGKSTEEVQSVREHCQNTAYLAGEAAKYIDLKNTAYLAGLIHDVGKYTDNYRQYLKKAVAGENVVRGSVNHTFACVRLMMEAYHNDNSNAAERLACEIIAYAAASHHALFDAVDEYHRSGIRYRAELEDIEAESAIKEFILRCCPKNELDKLFSCAINELSSKFSKIGENTLNYSKTIPSNVKENEANTATLRFYYFYISMLVRFISSCVIEGDRSDTAAFEANENAKKETSPSKDFWQQALINLENRLTELNIKANITPISKARGYISNACSDFADNPSAIYRFNAPTGGGKTLSTLRYALRHAALHGKKRIFYIAPFISIIEQNADEIRRAVGENVVVLEHHSNVSQDVKDNEELNLNTLFESNWHVPIVVTTQVQLINTLFSSKTSAVRRFHALADSIIILDEIQSLPVQLTHPFNLAMNFLSEFCSCSVLLCSATLPTLDRLPFPMNISAKTPINLSPEMQEVFRRTRIVDKGILTQDEINIFVKELLNKSSSLLVVCNKKKQAEELFAEIKGTVPVCCHLSSNMCVAHRRDVIAKLKKELSDNQLKESDSRRKVVCVSTQVIEAGVDISFETVIRFRAGMDSIIQSAGRCNRNGESYEPSNVYVVAPQGETLDKLDTIEKGKKATTELFDELGNEDPTADSAIKLYYKKYYVGFDKGYLDCYLPNLDTTVLDLFTTNCKFANANFANNHPNIQLRQAFKTAGSEYRIFDDTFSVLVPYRESKELIAELTAAAIDYDFLKLKALIKCAAPYCISVFPWHLDKLISAGAVYSISDNISLYILTQNWYDEQTGLLAKVTDLNYMEV
jgi:CRISPR-associated endonuclease/helicase Cas3